MSEEEEIYYYEIVLLIAFLMAQWYAARIFITLHIPTIPAEIGVGLLFGPHGADLIPKFSHEYSPLSLLGFIGVSLVIFESGMHLNVSKVFNLDVGPRVIIVACTGTVLPIVLGIAFFMALGYDAYPVSFLIISLLIYFVRDLFNIFTF